MAIFEMMHKDKKSYNSDKIITEHHRKIANHLDKAAKYHLEAASLYEVGQNIQAAQNIIAAQGHLLIANETQHEIVRLHALEDEIQ
ncbi:hypothetical protein [Chondrinema litorale]|uniref:hypothetical protein n=1 Tax=Chondrinema litorale TaxID=2994555 RepID=UPI002543A0B1|nr:hypothetical protein [Chondrinema litorale]UZR96764.1 hypothetical protein OQ292_23985 [Chondrinema litorale]UZR99975.1 hypothetical protein OQ292_39490 [Chondrinema litorale]